jgi:carboxymethylenebutenolidase
MVHTRYESITTPDGAFDAFCAVPEAPDAPAVLVFQEVFGINDNIRGLAGRLAEAGYLALAPDMFWRIEPRFERKDESGLADGFAMIQQLDFDLAAADITATMAHALAMPGCNGRVGGVGFCLGGMLAYLFATTTRVDGRGPDAVVHYGANDPYIPAEQIDEVERALAGRPDVTLHRYDAGHAFSNWDAPSLYDETAAREAWDRTMRFFDERLRPV